MDKIEGLKCQSFCTKVKKAVENIPITVILLFLGIMAGSASAEIPTLTEMTPSIEFGTNGMHFEINDSNYLNINLDTSETINITLETQPRKWLQLSLNQLLTSWEQR